MSVSGEKSASGAVPNAEENSEESEDLRRSSRRKRARASLSFSEYYYSIWFRLTNTLPFK